MASLKIGHQCLLGTGPNCGTLADQHPVYRYRGWSGALIPELILPSAKDLSNGRLVARNMLPHNAIEKTASRMSDVTQVYSAKLD